MAKTPWFGVAAIALGVLMAGSGCPAAEAPDEPALTGTTWRAETIMGAR